MVLLAYSFTDDDLGMAKIEAAGSGVPVSGVLEKSQALSNTSGENETLLKNGVDVHLDGNPASMHHKVILFDEKIVLMGSHSFNNSAKIRNDENALIIHDPETAALYVKEFERVWLKAPEGIQ
jgi:phosphatidylserine/phosphatidylglycerophosphate/cardiolipin synthase-like enzyme